MSVDKHLDTSFYVVDGTSHHIVNDVNYLQNLRPCHITVTNASTCETTICHYIGDMDLGKLKLDNVLFVPHLLNNIASLQRLLNDVPGSYDVGPTGMILYDVNGRPWLSASNVNGQMRLDIPRFSGGSRVPRTRDLIFLIKDPLLDIHINQSHADGKTLFKFSGGMRWKKTELAQDVMKRCPTCKEKMKVADLLPVPTDKEKAMKVIFRRLDMFLRALQDLAKDLKRYNVLKYPDLGDEMAKATPPSAEGALQTHLTFKTDYDRSGNPRVTADIECIDPRDPGDVPLASYSDLRLLLALCAQKRFRVTRIEIRRPFFNLKPKETTYVRVPQEFGGAVLQLNRSLTGLRCGPGSWYREMDCFLRSLAYATTPQAPCIYHNQNSTCLVLVHMDSLLVCGAGKEAESLKGKLSDRFETEQFCNPRQYFGIDLSFAEDGSIKLSARSKIDKIQKAYAIYPVQGELSCPLVNKLNLEDCRSPELSETEKNEYRLAVSGVKFIADVVRFDISYATSLLERYCDNPRRVHLLAAMQVIEFLVSTKYKGLWMRPNGCIHPELMRLTEIGLDDQLAVGNGPKHNFDDDDFVIFVDQREGIEEEEKGSGEDYTPSCESDIDDSFIIADRTDSMKAAQSAFISTLNGNIIGWETTQHPKGSLGPSELSFAGMSAAAISGARIQDVLDSLGLYVECVKICNDDEEALFLCSSEYGVGMLRQESHRFITIYNMLEAERAKLYYVKPEGDIARALTRRTFRTEREES